MNKITSVKYYLILTEGGKEIVSITTPIGVLPTKYQEINPGLNEGRDTQLKRIQEAKFPIYGVPFICFEQFTNPHQETEFFVIAKIALYDEKQSAKFLSLFERRQNNFHHILTFQEVKEFKNSYPKLFLGNAILDESNVEELVLV